MVNIDPDAWDNERATEEQALCEAAVLGALRVCVQLDLPESYWRLYDTAPNNKRFHRYEWLPESVAYRLRHLHEGTIACSAPLAYSLHVPPGMPFSIGALIEGYHRSLGQDWEAHPPLLIQTTDPETGLPLVHIATTDVAGLATLLEKAAIPYTQEHPLALTLQHPSYQDAVMRLCIAAWEASRG